LADALLSWHFDAMSAAGGKDEELGFGAEFPSASREQWLRLVTDVLKGAPFEERLRSKTYDRLIIEPLYPRDAAARPVSSRLPGVPWQAIQRIEHPDPAAANIQAHEDIESGATGLALVFAGATGAYGFGLPAGATALTRALDGIPLDAGVSLDLQLHVRNSQGILSGLTDLIRRRGTDPGAVHIRFGLDWIGALAAGGETSFAWNEVEQEFGRTVGSLIGRGFRDPFAVADATVIHNAGGSEVQELAYAIATALAYLRSLEAAGLPLDEARHLIYFHLAADADQLLSIAKFRGLRKLWARIEEACGLPPQPIFIAAETAWRMMTRHEPFANVLRTTIATVAAGVGGANAITVLPHTAAIGLSDQAARRIARNTQLILLEESNLARVADPAAGSGALENLTRNLCMAAWSLFQEIEQAGGAAEALERGLIQDKVAAVRAERERAHARRQDVLIGTSEFPNLAETSAEVLAPTPLGSAPSLQRTGETKRFAPLPCRRLAEPYEALRDASDRHLAETGERPKIFLANLGQPADFAARANYAKNFFETGGIEAVTNDGFASRPELVAAFKSSGARLACLCSSDEVYAAEAAAAASALARAGAMHLYLAGRPGEIEASLKSAGVGTLVHPGCDALATLIAAHSLIGLA
jgi:methylmalonyl-CoA mutase